MNSPERERCFLLSGLLLPPACGEHSEFVQRPHLILIVSDDHSYPDFGFMGSPHVQTPHLDRLASEGTSFRQRILAWQREMRRSAVLD